VSVTVNTTPSAPTAGTHVPGETEIEWNWNTVSDADGYAYNTTNDYSTATNNGTSTSYTQTGLDCETSYTLYVWAYNNDCGESDALELTETTSDCPSACDGVTPPSMDEHTYNIVGIGNQCWFAENLRTRKYADGSFIPNVTGNTDWYDLDDNDTDDAYCWYNNDSASYAGTYGALYTYAAATNGDNSGTNVQGACPDGWHLPSDTEWTELKTYLTDNGYDPGDLKATSGWDNNGNGSDNFGFTALPSGTRSYFSGEFTDAGEYLYWWSSTEYESSGAYMRWLGYDYLDMYSEPYYKSYAFSVRCIKD